MKNIIKCLFISVALLNLSTSFAAPTQNHVPAYLLGPGDLLEISVWKEEGLEKQVLVRPDGGITFPLVGELQAGGKTATQLQQALVNGIKKFIPDPVITVSVIKINDNKIFVVGKVNRPGEFVATHYMDVMQALAMAGGLNAYASSNNIKILRRVNGKETALPFEYDSVAQGEDLQQNIILKSGDVVVVP
ncbi:MAG: polysaccharide biosynthesis/export family protein [Gammaproteobacteria bacterium]|nr:polysaccharide biosynthesis/export family protein [Gammaproteobacteria bacterium]